MYKESLKYTWKYTRSIQCNKAKREEKTRKPLLTTQPINEIENGPWSTIYWTLTQPENMYKKDRKIAWSANSVSSKILLFLSFHKVQNKHKGAAFHAFFLFFPTKVPFQPRMVSLIELGKTQWTPKRAKIRCQIIAALGQWISTWFVDSSSALHK